MQKLKVDLNSVLIELAEQKELERYAKGAKMKLREQNQN